MKSINYSELGLKIINYLRIEEIEIGFFVELKLRRNCNEKETERETITERKREREVPETQRYRCTKKIV